MIDPLGAGLRNGVRRALESRWGVLRVSARALRGLVRAARDLRESTRTPSARALLFARLRRPGRLHQTTALTWADRYPDHFARAATLMGRDRQLNILSFGCSTGEEVLTLRRYFPAARIVGAEFNPESLAACRRLAVDDRVTFIESVPRLVARHGPFDIVFCMAVLQRTPHKVEVEGITNLSRIYPFTRYEAQVRELDEVLRPGGLLVIHHSQYRFEDTSLMEHYAPLPGAPVESTDVPFFAPSGERLPTRLVVETMFLKRS